MTEMLDPYELTAPDDEGWELPLEGAACRIEDDTCEACQ